MNITNEHGKALKDAYDDVLCGLGQYLFSILMSYNFLSHLVCFLNKPSSNGLLYSF